MASSRPRDRVEVRDVSRRRLDEGERDARGVGSDLIGEVVERHGAHLEAASGMQKRARDGGEVAVGHEDLTVVRHGAGDERCEGGHLRADGDTIRRHTDEPREKSAGLFDDRAVRRGVDVAEGSARHIVDHRLTGRARGQSDRAGREVAASAVERLARPRHGLGGQRRAHAPQCRTVGTIRPDQVFDGIHSLA